MSRFPHHRQTHTFQVTGCTANPPVYCENLHTARREREREKKTNDKSTIQTTTIITTIKLPVRLLLVLFQQHALHSSSLQEVAFSRKSSSSVVGALCERDSHDWSSEEKKKERERLLESATRFPATSPRSFSAHHYHIYCSQKRLRQQEAKHQTLLAAVDIQSIKSTIDSTLLSLLTPTIEKSGRRA